MHCLNAAINKYVTLGTEYLISLSVHGHCIGLQERTVQ